MKRETRNFFIELAIVLCITICLLCKATDLLELKSSDRKYTDFFKQKEPFDVLFLGTSHVTNGIFPMELWNNHGIVSYNFGGHGNEIATTYWVMKNALDYTSPKLVVIDCLKLRFDQKTSTIFSQVHTSLDAFPLCRNKIRAVCDLLDDPEMDTILADGKTNTGTEPRTKIGLLWDFSVYHARWNELQKDDFQPISHREKGAESRISVVRGKMDPIPPEQKSEPDTTAEQYLRRMIEECRDRGIEVLLIYLPFPAGSNEQAEANRVSDIAQEYGLNYINFLNIDLVNFQTDLYDSKSHLNPSGARKVTAYLGDYLKSHYDLPDRRTDEAYSFWADDYEDYNELKDQNLRKQESLINYLMLLSGDAIDIAIDVRKPEAFENRWILSLMNNIGIDETALDLNTRFILKRTNGESCVLPALEPSEERKTPCGTVRYSANEEEYTLSLDGKTVCSGKMKDDAGMKITVFRNGRQVDSVGFSFYVNSVKELESINANR